MASCGFPGPSGSHPHPPVSAVSQLLMFAFRSDCISWVLFSHTEGAKGHQLPTQFEIRLDSPSPTRIEPRVTPYNVHLADVPASLGWDGQGTGPEGGREQDGDLAPGVCLSWFLAALSRLWLSRSLKLGAAGLAQEETPWAPALSPDLTPGVGLFRQSGPDRGAWPSDGGQRPRQGPGGGGAARGPQHDGEAGEGGEAGGRGWGSVVSAQLLRDANIC